MMFNRTQYPQEQDIWAANKGISIARKKSKMDEEEVEDSSPSKKNHSTLPRLQARTSFLTRTQLTKRDTRSSGRKSLQTVQQIYKRKRSSAEQSGVQVALLLGPIWPRRPYLLEGVCGEERCCMSVQQFYVTIPCVVRNSTLFRNQHPLPDHQGQYFCQDDNHFTCLLVSWYEESKVTRQQLKF